MNVTEWKKEFETVECEQRRLGKQRRELMLQLDAVEHGELRQATSRDVFVGNVIFYPRQDGGVCSCDTKDMSVHVIQEVLRPSDEFKAFIDEEGCRYGLDGAFVELERVVGV